METSKRELLAAVGLALGAGAVPAAALAAGQPSQTAKAVEMIAVGSRKKILITGAGTGFGHETALRLAARGHEVIATVELPAQVTQLRQAARDQGRTLRVEKINILHERDRELAASYAPDILLNNAGIGEGGTVAEMPMDVFRSQFETNVFSALDLSQKVIRSMVEAKRPGKILFMSSVLGLFSPAYTGAYSASKHAIEAIAESLHAELQPYGIKVATINPGPYLTGFNDRMMDAAKIWYDPKTNFIDQSKLTFQGDQFDPKTAIADIVQVIEADNGKFRNVIPAQFGDVVRKIQNSTWDASI